MEWRDGLAPLCYQGANSPIDRDTTPDRSTPGLIDRCASPRLKTSTIVTMQQAGGNFKTGPDYAKINAECHNALRTDTFSTPTSLHSVYHTPSRLEKRRAQDDPAEFQRKMCKSVKDLQDVQAEFRQSMETLRNDMTNSLQEQAGARGTLEQIRDSIGALEQESRRPLDFSSLVEEIRSLTTNALERQHQMESRLLEQMRQVQEEINTVRLQQEQAEKGHLVQIHEEIINVRLVADVKDVVRRSELQLAEVLSLTQSMRADSSRTSMEVQDIQREQRQNYTKTMQDVQSLHEESKKHYADFVPCLQSQLEKYHDENIISVDLDEIIRLVTKTRGTVKEGFEQVLTEISSVQQALNVDFLRVVDGMNDAMRKSLADLEERHSPESMKRTLTNGEDSVPLAAAYASRKTITKQRKRFRNFFVQTEAEPGTEMWVQTDDELWMALTKEKTQKGFKAKRQRRLPKKKETNQVLSIGKESMQQSPGKVFHDAESMKAKVRQTLMKPQYNVADFYHENGFFQHIARHYIFEQVTLFVIFLNVIWIGIDTDHNDASILIDADLVFQVVENIFCTFFSFELLIRFLAFSHKRNCLRDYWFVFDAALVTVMISETWILSIVILAIGKSPSGDFGGLSILRIFRFARVVRVSRLARLLRAIPEVVVLLKSVGIAIRSVMIFFVLWVVLIFVFAIVFRQLTDGDDIGDRYFKSVPSAMNTLLLNGLLPENESIVNQVSESNPMLWILIMSFILLASLTLMHMLLGVLVENISVISVAEKEGMAVVSVSTQLRETLIAYDRDPEAPLSKQEFDQLIMEPAIANLFRNEGVDTNVLIDMSEIIFQDLDLQGRSGLTFELLVETVLNMRGSNPATVKDVKEQLRLTKTIIRETMGKVHKDIAVDIMNMKQELTAIMESRLRAIDSEAGSSEGEADEMFDMHHLESSVPDVPLPGENSTTGKDGEHSVRMTTPF